jgi:hypothetical protein
MKKQIVFSNHAENRRKQRGLNKEHIFLVITHPEYVKRINDKRIAVKTIYERTITAVYVEDEAFIKVITIY